MATIHTILQGFTTGTSEGSLAFCAVTLVRGRHLTLVDVGYHARIGLLLQKLNGVGVRPGQIDRVVLTHLHWDHCLNLSSFPNAEVFVAEDEYEYAKAPHPMDWATPPWAQDIVARAKAMTLTRDGDELEPGVRIVTVPGHSPGTQMVTVEQEHGLAGICGDALTSRAGAAVLAPGRIFHDERLARQSARKIVESCQVIYPGHDRPFRVEGGAFRYIETTAIEFLNPPRDEDGTLRASISEAPLPSEPIVEACATAMA